MCGLINALSLLLHTFYYINLPDCVGYILSDRLCLGTFPCVLDNPFAHHMRGEDRVQVGIDVDPCTHC